MLRIYHKNKIIFIGYFIFILSGLFLLAYLGKSQSHLFLTGFHSLFLEHLMKLFTWLGDGIFMVLIGILLLFKRIRYGLLILSSFLISSLFVQILKRLIFYEYKRPVAWFHDLGLEIYRIPGVDYYSLNSFPSGHTTTAFAMFFGLSFFVKENSLKMLLLVLAVITGFSRIYLSQHFIADVLGGSVLGVIAVVFMHIYIENQQYEWLNENILSLLRKKIDKA